MQHPICTEDMRRTVDMQAVVYVGFVAYRVRGIYMQAVVYAGYAGCRHAGCRYTIVYAQIQDERLLGTHL